MSASAPRTWRYQLLKFKALTALVFAQRELAEQIFDVPVRRGVPTGVGGLVDRVESAIHATAVGLVRYGAVNREAAPLPETTGGSAFRRMGRRVTGWIGDIF